MAWSPKRIGVFQRRLRGWFYDSKAYPDPVSSLVLSHVDASTGASTRTGLPTFTSNSFPWGTVGLSLGIGAAVIVAGAILLPRVLSPSPAPRRAPPRKAA